MKSNTLCLGKKIIESPRKAFVMGIVNATPDSFFENSRGGLDLALKLIDDGADILDIGGESTRPGFAEVSEDEEISRVVPLIQKIRQINDKIPISVDTRKMAVMKAAYENGADVLNDVSALEFDSKMAGFISSTELSVILMFWKAGGIKEAKKYLKQRVLFAKKSGIKKEKIILDPGIGFDKSFEENCQLIKNCGDLAFGGIPVLMALSNKRCIGAMINENEDSAKRGYGTACANLFAVESGAKIIRVHDVKSAIDSLNVMKFLK